MAMVRAAKVHPQERPLLFYKVGIHGSTPKDFGETFAAQFDTAYLSTAGLREVILEQRIANGNPITTVDTKSISKKLIGTALPILRAGRDVMADVFLNSPKKRRQGATELAYRTGGLAVGFNILTPTSIVESRIIRWAEEDDQGIPVAEWPVSPIDGIERALQSLVRPESSERPGLIIDVDGSVEDADELIGQIEDRLLKEGLAT